MCKRSYHSRFLSLALVLFAILTLNLAVAFAQDKTSKEYRCTAKDAVSVLDDGTLSKEVGKAVALKVYDKMVINVSNGNITLPDLLKVREWIVEKTAVNENDYVLFPKPTQKAIVANAVVHFIRLNAGVPQPRFAAVALSYLVTGTCDILR